MAGVLEQRDQDVFQQIFEEHWEHFKKHRPYFDCAQYNDAVAKMLGCGRESGGYSEYQCLYCGHGFRRVCFSCKGTFCLSCSRSYSENVVHVVSRSLHSGVTYRHLVLTIPEQLKSYFYTNRYDGSLLSSFMRLGYESIEGIISAAKRQALKVGCIVVVQTDGRSGSYNPHLHIILTDGGMNEKTEKWVDLGYLNYHMLHQQWQSFLLKWVESSFGNEVKPLVEELKRKYPKGFVAHLGENEAPQSARGLARYLAKYVASPPISIKRILDYDGQEVKYWYNDHKSKGKKIETVPVFVFIGRMVQHIMPKGFQRIRYYGLQATKTFKKWKDAIVEGIRKIGQIVKGAYQVVGKKNYQERYKQVSLFDPLLCPECRTLMEVSRIWHPKYGDIYNVMDTLSLVVSEEQQEEKEGNQKSEKTSIRQPLLPGLENSFAFSAVF